MEKIIGKVSKIVGPVVEAVGVKDTIMLELVEVGEERLIGEVLHIKEQTVTIQVYEDTTGLRPGADVYGSGMPLSVELGPGLIGGIYDGVQRPLTVIRDTSKKYYIQRGVHIPSVDREKKWHFVPCVKKGDYVKAGTVLGTIQESELIVHKIMVPNEIRGTVHEIAEEGDYLVEDTIASVKKESADLYKVCMMQRWPIRKPRPINKKLPLSTPLITGQRVIDTLFPVAKGGAVAVPGGFGTGKTLVQHQLAKWCDADIIVYIGCGERGNEMTDVLLNFPKLIDPRTGAALMERTIIVANTSNMPVAAREASIYTGITLAEYYRDMGYHVAVMADSTSRWAEALRELSGRMEEMPADEGFPSYLPSRLAEFYERGGMVETLNNHQSSISIIGAVSPPGGDFSEPVTQHTKRYVMCFWALDRDLANARHYPSISWLESYSEYTDEISLWWQEKIDPDWRKLRDEMIALLQKEVRLEKVVKLVGPDVLPDTQKLILEVCGLFKKAFLQQNAFDKVDTFSTPQKQFKMLKIIVHFYEKGLEAIRKGSTLLRLKKMKVYNTILRMKLTIPNSEVEKLDELYDQMIKGFDRLERFTL